MSTNDILFEKRGALGLVTLNRPQALNALTQAMALAHHAQLNQWAADSSVHAVLIQGTGGKAFCAGGDIMALHQAGTAGEPGWENFFADEYRMNYAIGTYPKPYIALLNGIVMGGGVGLSVHGRYRIATDNTLFAMPECGIGLVPDVGGTNLLGHMQGELGVFLGVTGERLKAADALWSGVATHHVSADKIEALIADLANAIDPATAVAAYNRDPGAAPLATHMAAINTHFGQPTLEAIFESLSLSGEAWALAVRDRMMGLSPTSMKLALRSIRAARRLDLAGCLRQEYRMVSAIKSDNDFYEGVRATLIDKDKKPRWRPAAFGDVTDAMVEAHFQAPSWGDLALN
jgi:enoyl-CoA hydratase